MLTLSLLERLAHARADAEAARRAAAENQLKLLESQLEPHMLFNTLANLRVLIGIDPPRAQAMLDRLIAFLRATLNASRSTLHPLATEFERIGDYLALMGMRMGPRLQSQLSLPDALRDVGVPPLLLQPLVENSIKHGLEPQIAGGRIEVDAAARRRLAGAERARQRRRPGQRRAAGRHRLRPAAGARAAAHALRQPRQPGAAGRRRRRHTGRIRLPLQP